MIKNSINKSEAEILRQKAIALLKKKTLGSISQLTEAETLKLIHELEVHQIELQLQNEELVLARFVAQEAAEKYSELYDFAPSGYFTLSNEGEIMELNLCGSQMLGKERSLLKNKLFGFFVSNDTKKIFNLFLENAFNSNTKVSCKVILSTCDNSAMYVYLTGIVTVVRKKCLVTMVDITELKQVEQALIIAKEKSEESDRLKSAFLANMSHEIRTPMNGILGFTELLKKHDLKGEKQQQYISMIEKGGARMLNIINDLIDISKIESGQILVSLSPCNVNEQIEYMYTFFKPEVERKGMQIFYQNTLPMKDAVIETDREKILAILTNLINNAIKYSDKGTIEFGYNLKQAGKPVIKPVRELAELTNSKTLDKEACEPVEMEFFVKDTGLGISPDKMKVIFDRFIQVNNNDARVFQGVGLGLAISKAYVEMLGGKIWVESETGKGSTFFFAIPYNDKPEVLTANKKVVSVEETETKIKKLKILIAEDDESSAMLQTEIVKNHCSKVLYAETGIEAVEACRNNPDIDLVLMDIQMPEMNGHEATRQIRLFNKDIVIIAQTAFVLSGDREKAIKAGCNDYISKPYNQTLMLALIEKYFN